MTNNVDTSATDTGEEIVNCLKRVETKITAYGDKNINDIARLSDTVNGVLGEMQERPVINGLGLDIDRPPIGISGLEAYRHPTHERGLRQLGKAEDRLFSPELNVIKPIPNNMNTKAATDVIRVVVAEESEKGNALKVFVTNWPTCMLQGQAGGANAGEAQKGGSERGDLTDFLDSKYATRAATAITLLTAFVGLGKIEYRKYLNNLPNIGGAGVGGGAPNAISGTGAAGSAMLNILRNAGGTTLNVIRSAGSGVARAGIGSVVRAAPIITGIGSSIAPLIAGAGLAGSAGLIGGTAIAGYAAGTAINFGLNKLVKATTGENKGFGGIIFDLLNKDKTGINGQPRFDGPTAQDIYLQKQRSKGLGVGQYQPRIVKNKNTVINGINTQKSANNESLRVVNGINTQKGSNNEIIRVVNGINTQKDLNNEMIRVVNDRNAEIKVQNTLNGGAVSGGTQNFVDIMVNVDKEGRQQVFSSSNNLTKLNRGSFNMDPNKFEPNY